MPLFETYLNFDGTCAAAMRFYESVLGGRIENMTTCGQSPMAAQFPPEYADRILHSRLVFDGGTLMASDTMGQPYNGMKGFGLTLSYPTVAEATRSFAALSEGGQVQMPLQKTFWAEAFGALVDRFGTPWMVNGALAKM